jgi:D-Tyr-tRNAtyr deacylase
VLPVVSDKINPAVPNVDGKLTVATTFTLAANVTHD